MLMAANLPIVAWLDHNNVSIITQFTRQIILLPDNKYLPSPIVHFNADGLLCYYPPPPPRGGRYHYYCGVPALLPLKCKINTFQWLLYCHIIIVFVAGRHCQSFISVSPSESPHPLIQPPWLAGRDYLRLVCRHNSHPPAER